jgi:DNA (cytosine-5)-methyltransferase 1
MRNESTPLRVLDLFSGIGGFSLGLERTGGFETIAFCEIDPFCRRVLRKHWPKVPIHDDVRKLTANDVGDVDVICGGYPCQGESVAGKRLGKADDRWLWPPYFRLIKELWPTWVIGENVAGHVTLGLDIVLSDLESIGYSWRPFVIPACAVDARHRRDRIWVVANRDGGQRFKPEDQIRAGGVTTDGRREAVANAERERGCGRDARRAYAEDAWQSPGRKEFRFWDAEPSVGRVANGVPHRVDRLRALGNAVVPQIPEIIGMAILQAEASHRVSKTVGLTA